VPVLAIPAIMGGAPVNHGLATAAYLGAGVFVLLIGAGAALFNTDAPLEWLGRTIQRALNATVRRRRPVTGLSRRLLSDRDFIRSTLDRGWRSALLAAVGNTGLDYLALLCALRAVGASPRPWLVVLAYAAAELAAQIPFTPGGLGFVEAGLVGTLTLAGTRPPLRLPPRSCTDSCRTGSPFQRAVWPISSFAAGTGEAAVSIRAGVRPTGISLCGSDR